MGLMFIVAAAARAVARGASLEDIRTVAERMIPNVRIMFVLDTLEYLRRGGRIGRARALLGTVLRVKPILTIEPGAMKVPDQMEKTPGRRIPRQGAC